MVAVFAFCLARAPFSVLISSDCVLFQLERPERVDSFLLLLLLLYCWDWVACSNKLPELPVQCKKKKTKLENGSKKKK